MIVFVAAISEYDELCWEDDQTNRMCETKKLFETLATNTFFSNSVPYIILLNKIDIFKEKVKTIPFKPCSVYDGYEGPDPPGEDCSQAIEYLKKVFLDASCGERKIYFYLTNATDESSIKDALDGISRDLLQW